MFRGASAQAEVGPTGNEGWPSGSDSAARRPEPYVISDERLDEIRAMVESDKVGRVWLSTGTTPANCAGAIYDLLAERDDRG